MSEPWRSLFLNFIYIFTIGGSRSQPLIRWFYLLYLCLTLNLQHDFVQSNIQQSVYFTLSFTEKSSVLFTAVTVDSGWLSPQVCCGSPEKLRLDSLLRLFILSFYLTDAAEAQDNSFKAAAQSSKDNCITLNRSKNGFDVFNSHRESLYSGVKTDRSLRFKEVPGSF